MSSPTNAEIVSRYVASALDRPLPEDALEAARMCLADWIGVLVGAHGQGAGRAVRDVASGWGAMTCAKN